MWSFPVTFGGGITMTNRGDPAAPCGWKRPSASQTEYQRSSTDEGSKFLGSLLAALSASAGAGFSGIKKGSERPSYIALPRDTETGREFRLISRLPAAPRTFRR